MAVKVRDVSKIDLVLVGIELLKSPEEVQSFRRALGVDVQMGSGTATETNTGETHPLTAVALQRERIIVSSFPARSVINKEFPSLTRPGDDWDRFAEVAVLAMASSDQANLTPRAYGYNYSSVIEIDHDETAAILLGKRMLTNKQLGKAEWGLIGGSASMIFSDGDRRWTFNLQPQPFGDPDSKRITCEVNLNVGRTRLPDQREIIDSLEEVWTEANRFITNLGESE